MPGSSPGKYLWIAQSSPRKYLLIARILSWKILADSPDPLLENP
jgi:hypothetical protein